HAAAIGESCGAANSERACSGRASCRLGAGCAQLLLLFGLRRGAQLGAVRGQVENLARRIAIVLQQAKATSDLLIGLFLTAEVTPEAVLVQLLTLDHVPPTAVVQTEFISPNYAIINAVPDAAEFQHDLHPPDIDRREHAAHEIDHAERHG